jgi:hypothetical protein
VTGADIQSLLIVLVAAKKTSADPLARSSRIRYGDRSGVDGAMRPRMIKHGYRPAKIKPVTDG